MTGGPLFVSSGKAAADREYRSALECVARGDLAEAAEILRRTVELAPAFATAWFALGAIRDNLGDTPGAIAAGSGRATPIPRTTTAPDCSWRGWERAKARRR
jgi:tetratricopeptide (TPR) repeat protein